MTQNRKIQQSNFVDYVKIFCRSGRGGAGSIHFRREKFVPKGGPDGGDGGHGGHIILKGNSQLWTLLHLRYKKHVFAENGEDGGRQSSFGKNGQNMTIEVPLGTIVKDSETDKIIYEIEQHDEKIILIKGGMGGLGNIHFKSSTNQTPRYAQPGIEGIEKWITLELKILADVGLIGFPNAGKSTLLSVVSAAKPEIANYAFTTLTPNLGIVAYRNNHSFVMADIPGIIQGASKGKGLGLQFLKHIERNSVLLFLIPCDTQNIVEEYNILIQELKNHNPEILNKRRVLAITKSDYLDDELKQEIQKDLPNIPYVFISSIANIGITQLKDKLWKALQS